MDIRFFIGILYKKNEEGHEGIWEARHEIRKTTVSFEEERYKTGYNRLQGSSARIRTWNQSVNSRLLCRLSYRGKLADYTSRDIHVKQEHLFMIESSHISFIQKSARVQVSLPDGRTMEGSRGSSLEEFFHFAHLESSTIISAATCRNELIELSQPVTESGAYTPLTIASADGARIYRRSLVLLLMVAVRELFPEADVAVDHSVSDGGYFCNLAGHELLSAEDVRMIEDRMRAIVQADDRIDRREVPLQEAIEILRRQRFFDTVRLLGARQKEYLTLYRLHDVEYYLHGYMVPSSGYLRLFQIEFTPPGFMLRFPRRDTPTQILPNDDFPKLRQAFQEYGEWQDRLGLEDVGMLNEAVLQGRGRELILVAEALHDQKTAEIARAIVSARDRLRLVLIAGPSSSGKTTFSRRLAIQMLSQGLRPYPLEMDNFFVDRVQTPKDDAGNFDFESFDALDRPLLNEKLQQLIQGEPTILPKYDFVDGCRKEGDTIHLPEGSIIVMEGIHGLNPELVPGFRPEEVFRIYVSALTQLNLDRHNRVSTTDTRLIRRLVRDVIQRGHSPAATLRQWESVRRGERKNIFPYQENADMMFNSALVYELSVLRPLGERLLRQVDPETQEYVEAKRLLAFLAWFQPLSADFIPDDSILREFIGSSILEDFRVWSMNP
jgi:uridine kinase